MDQSRAPAYRLVRRPRAGAAAGGPPGSPRLDQAQQQVVDHAGGPLLVLAGPGTGKTTTIVAAVADRIENRGIAPERILVLTFSRKAAAELRERITARLRRTTREPLAGAAAPGPGHQGLRRGGTRPAAPRGRARPGRPRAAPAR